ncbi:histidine phosphatase family protein [Paenibacillus hemerocallicola]|uniref:Histidine phosphatase family protein n=1 Tax=Paenibacillus hemerocallicola TaxID=1172614 RepID=A0A5C4T3G6_9BACL|nr:histidine phosphatase family protein [Paenibacillus hemerocallicola]TNJ63583.1 histidine phosphatase family protein [Paenibacillus hemerocallicola]
MTTLGFIRHGTTDWNVSGRLQGQNDIPLNEAGRWQARELGKRLKREQWDAIVSSDLMRAKETADIIAEIAGIGPVRAERRLRERTHGRLDGTTVEERIATWGAEWKTLEHGVESDELLYERGIACLEELSAEYEGKRVLVVTHGAFIGVLLNGMLTRMPDGSIQNTSLSVLKKNADGWECALFNCTAHL